MDIDVSSHNDMPTVMRTLRTALRTEGALDARERLFLDTCARLASGPRSDDDPRPLRPDEVALLPKLDTAAA